MPLPNDYPELPYKTAREMIDEFEAGVKFIFVRRDSLEPVLEMLTAEAGKKVRCLDRFSEDGDTFYPNGRRNRPVATISIALAEHVWAKPAETKPAAPKDVEITQIRSSDLPGIKAAQAALPPPMTPAPAFMVAPLKSSDGLAIVHNPDKKFVWGA